MQELPRVIIPIGYNYVACFLTLRCNLKCSYCLNMFGAKTRKRHEMSAEDWIAGLSRIKTTRWVPVTIEGGEPTCHEGFFDIMQRVSPEVPFDLLTNMEFKLKDFLIKVPRERFRRVPGCTSIRVSYHPPQHDLELIALKCHRLQVEGFSIGIAGVLTEENRKYYTSEFKHYLRIMGVEFGTKEELGVGKGTYRHPEAVCGKLLRKKVLCRSNDLVIGPTGHLYKCHSDMYAMREPIGHLLDPQLRIEWKYRPCENFGLCHPCDFKVKVNNYFEEGHTGVELKLDGE